MNKLNNKGGNSDVFDGISVRTPNNPESYAQELDCISVKLATVGV